MLSAFSDSEVASISAKRHQYALYVITLLYPWSENKPLPFEENMSWWLLYIKLEQQDLFSSFAKDIISNLQDFYDNFLEEMQEESFIENVQEVYMRDHNLDLVDTFNPDFEKELMDSTVELCGPEASNVSVDTDITKTLRSLKYCFCPQNISFVDIPSLQTLVAADVSDDSSERPVIDHMQAFRTSDTSTTVLDYVLHALNETDLFKNHAYTQPINDSSPPTISEQARTWMLNEEQQRCFFFLALIFLKHFLKTYAPNCRNHLKSFENHCRRILPTNGIRCFFTAAAGCGKSRVIKCSV